ncbi:MAG TPA: fused MFS/spermidine synthase [Bdellovibrionales bacterium]|nr:fused MFS/spermidine synthase [Bdellovibrionales bacterium]
MAYLVYAVTFIAGFCLMSFEILASRLIEPYFGSDVYSWTNLIGTFLAAMAAGYWLGGKIAHRKAGARGAAYFLLVSGLLVAAAPLFTYSVCNWLLTFNLPVHYLSLLACLVLFAPPMIALGTLTPFVMRERTRAFNEVGLLAGRIGSVSTAGSLAGTFFTTFVFLNFESLGVKTSAQLVGALLSVSGFALALALRPGAKALAGAAVFLASNAALVAGSAGVLVPPVLGAARLVAETHSPYNTLRVLEEPWRLDSEKNIRRLVFKGGHGAHSAILVDEKTNPSLFYYTNLLTLAWGFNPSIRRIAIVGAGGGVAARDLLRWLPSSRAPGLEVDVVDIDPKTFELARRHFGYPSGDPRLRDHVADARVFFSRAQKTYDLVFLDAMGSDARIPLHLVTAEFFALVRSRLSENGVMLMHFPQYSYSKMHERTADEPTRFHALLKTLRQVFGDESVRLSVRAKLRSPEPRLAANKDFGSVFVALNADSAFDSRSAVEAFAGFEPDIAGNTLSDYLATLLAPAELKELGAAYERVPMLTDDLNRFNFLAIAQ